MRLDCVVMNKSVWICLLALGCSSSAPARDKVDWVEFTGEQKTWPLALKAVVDRPRNGVPIYRSAPLHPYDIIGFVRTSAGARAASRLAKQQGAEALLWEPPPASTNSVAARRTTDPQLFRAIRFTQAAALRQIQGHQAALDWLQQHPNGGTIETGNGATVIEASRVNTLRETWSGELARLRTFASTNVWTRPPGP